MQLVIAINICTGSVWHNCVRVILGSSHLRGFLLPAQNIPVFGKISRKLKSRRRKSVTLYVCNTAKGNLGNEKKSVLDVELIKLDIEVGQKKRGGGEEESCGGNERKGTGEGRGSSHTKVRRS